jgi:hypothetical protein
MPFEVIVADSAVGDPLVKLLRQVSGLELFQHSRRAFGQSLRGAGAGRGTARGAHSYSRGATMKLGSSRGMDTKRQEDQRANLATNFD